jgi:predicted AlkP superfamily phosphohydrolase/phosphomutase
LLLIGMDAFPPALLDRWCASGDLPNIAALIREGRYGRVDSVGRHFPGAVWATFSSASLPSVHGIHHFMQWDPDRMTYRRPAPDWCGYTPFWRRPIGDQPPAISFDLPFAFPGTTPGVVEVHGWGMHDELAPPFSEPHHLLAEIRRRHGRSALRPDVLGPRPVAALQRDLEGIVDSVNRRFAIIEDLARRFPWRLFLAPFAETHRAGHWYWTERSTGVAQEGIKRVAAAIDRGLPRLRALLGPDDQFALFSLHGMGEFYDLERFSEPLLDALEPSRAAAPSRAFDPVRLLNGLLPGGLRRTVSAAFSTALRDRLFGHTLAAGVDWSKARFIALPPDCCVYLRLNLEGREREGSVSPADAVSLLEATAARLRELRDPEGQPVLSEVSLTASLVGEGPRSQLLPDLVLRADRHVADRLHFPDGAEVRAPWRGWRDGDHRPEGFYIQVGPAVPAGSAGPPVPEEALGSYLGAPAGLQFRA